MAIDRKEVNLSDNKSEDLAQNGLSYTCFSHKQHWFLVKKAFVDQDGKSL
jgi:hypothetical protein